ncbi:hypothetical protein SARC_05842 [Sphaeroforma arctica JP610]|uniref:Bud22 domain-containing protein n=1 Tax=Sphaeroforma arctica JP610 TaxID=667725 RepID=A0A0L0FZ52_9EUKA|nr:hypothetical protein, variant [Sphaeroforma arctica JP610]XP_014155754.1 hypothetical protein SARC_05842 [Sphaeroforma arctica JP610]KNC81851.1 hypothetical protein, variant [Sphaeroforma arctica JP610]KNC81852.1 hypothetical protein SARC_05842 [Sphaeroforma arctica JP610]|eukprot:XP_014155753.1 hypothetical protein, variant [Sphaeroforma arctica JP610]
MAAALKTLKLANMAAVSVGMVGFLGKCKLESLEMTKNIERLLLKHYPDLEGEPTVALDTIAPKDSGDTDSDSDSDSSSSSDSDSDSDGDDKASEASKKTRESKEKTEASASTSDSSSGSDSDGETKVKQEEVSATSKAETPSAAVEPKAFTETGEKATSTTEGKPTVTDTPKGTDEDKPVAKKVLGPPNVVRLAAIRLLRSEPVEKVRQEILVREKERAEKERIEAEKEDVRKEAQRKAKEKKRAVLADDGSEDDLPGMIKAPEKKKRNRMSQQARRKLAEETHGNEANHIKNSKPRDANKPKDVTKDAKPKQPVVEIPADVHASWAAAMKRKAQTEAKFDGKKMKFDD